MLHLLEIQLGDTAHYSHNANSMYGIAFDIVGLRGITNSRWRWFLLLIAVPFRSLWFRHTEDYYVVEIDGERPKEAEMIAGWLKPDVCLWISVGNSHAVYYDSLVSSGQFTTVEEAIANEFASIPKNTKDLVVIDAENPLMKQFTGDIDTKVVAVSGQPDSYTVLADHTAITVDGHSFQFAFPTPKSITTQLNMLVVIARYLEIPITTDLSQFVMPPGRSNYFEGKKGIKIIDSTYNAHLLSMQSILDMYSQIDEPHKWLVIGDMIEQGKSEASEHQKLANLLQTMEVETIILVGKRTAKYVLPILEESSLTSTIKSFTTTQDALAYIETNGTGRETILLKGSQYLEWIVEKLLAHPADISHLARQEPAAKKRRLERGLS